MNNRNYAQPSNFTCGTEQLDLLPFYALSVNIPSLSFSTPEGSGRSGTKLKFTSDNVTFGSISINVLLDEDYQIYKDINKIIFDHINVETGTFADFYFDFWVEIQDDMGKKVMKVEYYNCRVESLGELALESGSDITEMNFTLDLAYDYHKIITENIPTLRV